MRVVIRTQLSGTRNGEYWPAPGGSIDLPDDEANDLIRLHIAEPVPAPEKVERAVRPPAPERAVRRQVPKE